MDYGVLPEIQEVPRRFQEVSEGFKRTSEVNTGGFWEGDFDLRCVT